MPETTTERLAALIGLVAALALVFVALSLRTDRAAVHVAAPAEAEALPATNATRTEEPVARVASRPVTGRPAPAETATLVLKAARGDCWLSVHAGTPDGNVLYEGVLTNGRTISVKGARLWVRLGAAANLDLTLNGRKVAALPAGTFDVVATPRGVRPAT
jgi:hypothetical protein